MKWHLVESKRTKGHFIVQLHGEKLRKTNKKMSRIGLQCSKYTTGDFPDGPVVKNPPSNAGMRVQSLVRELGSHMPRHS